MPIPLTSYDGAEMDRLFGPGGPFEGIARNANFVVSDYEVLAITDTDTAQATFANKDTVRRVYSFPETHLDLAGNRLLFLDYGKNNSIVANITFDGDMRVLQNLAGSHYGVRQWKNLEWLFGLGSTEMKDGDDTSRMNAIELVISDGLSTRIQQLLAGGALPSENRDLRNLMRIEKAWSQDKNNWKQEAQLNAELIELFPQLITSYETDEDLVAVLGENSATDMRVLASLIGNKNWLNILFPDAEIDGRNNMHKNTSIMVNRDGSLEVTEDVSRIYRRKVDFTYLRSKISDFAQQSRLADSKQQYQAAMQNEVWNLTLTTLGIPELDVMADDFLARRVILQVYDSRQASGKHHWLSGQYMIVGVKHTLEPNNGYLSELTIVKDQAHNLTKLKDSRELDYMFSEEEG